MAAVAVALQVLPSLVGTVLVQITIRSVVVLVVREIVGFPTMQVLEVQAHIATMETTLVQVMIIMLILMEDRHTVAVAVVV